MDESHIPLECELCGRERRLNFHHLIPRTVHSNKWFKKRFNRDEMNSGIYICRACHSYLHKHFTHKELARDLNTKETLLANEVMQRPGQSHQNRLRRIPRSAIQLPSYPCDVL